jgi:hypothetical protein
VKLNWVASKQVVMDEWIASKQVVMDEWIATLIERAVSVVAKLCDLTCNA